MNVITDSNELSGFLFACWQRRRCLMVVTNRLWDSINGFRFQYVVLVFHDGFCAIFEDSVKVKRKLEMTFVTESTRLTS